MSEESLSTELRAFKREFENLSTKELPPQTTLQVLGQQNQEYSWNRLLTYFLDPDKPHGFGDDVLRGFLQTLESKGILQFTPNRLALTNVKVDREIPTESGQIDILIRSESDWFVWIEMKVHSPEGENQTQKYVNDTTVGTHEKADFPKEMHHYVFLARQGEYPDHDDFKSLAWKELLTAFGDVLAHGRTNYPLTSYAQLQDFTNAIKREFQISMGPQQYQDPLEERVQLYYQYIDEIHAVEQAIEEYCEQEQDGWWIRFLEEFKPDHWDSENWFCKKKDSRWGQIYHRSWTRQDPEQLQHTPLLHYEHEWDASLLKKGELRFDLECEDKLNSHDDLRQKIKELFVEKYASRAESLSGPNTEINTSKSSKKYLAKSRYEFEYSGGNGYYETLQQAFDDNIKLSELVVEMMAEVRDFEQWESFPSSD